MSSETTGEQQPPERPAPNTDDEIDAERERRQHGLAGIPTDPGDRYTTNVGMLVIEAELACGGVELGNPAKIPADADDVAEAFAERLDQHDDDLVPAWTRPWEVIDDE